MKRVLIMLIMVVAIMVSGCNGSEPQPAKKTSGDNLELIKEDLKKSPESVRMCGWQGSSYFCCTGGGGIPVTCWPSPPPPPALP